MFQEAGIVSRNRRVERMRVIIGWASLSLATIVILGMAALWYFSYLGNKQLIADFDTAIGTYQQQVAASGLALNPVQDARLDLILPPLQTLRTMPAGYDQSRLSTPWSLRFGLYQGDKLGADADAAYRRALNGLLLPRLLYRLESQLRANIDNQEFVYQALKVYLMLGSPGTARQGSGREWMAADWNAQFPGRSCELTRDQLAAHLDAMLEQPLTQIALDGNLLTDARRSLEQYPVSQRAYSILKQSAARAQLAAVARRRPRRAAGKADHSPRWQFGPVEGNPRPLYLRGFPQRVPAGARGNCAEHGARRLDHGGAVADRER